MTSDWVAGAGLRERKKSAMRRALSQAALRLAAERGFEHVLVEDIAAEVGVSPRTFNNYFSGKEEAICGTGEERAERVGAALNARPAAEPLAQALRHALPIQFHDDPELDRARVKLSRLVRSTPALRAQQLKSYTAIEPVLAEAIAERTGTDPATDLYPNLIAGIVATALRVTFEHWLHTEPDATSTSTFLPVLDEALERLFASLPTPPQR